MSRRRVHPATVFLAAAPLVVAGLAAFVWHKSPLRKLLPGHVGQRARGLRELIDDVVTGRMSPDVLRPAILGSGKGAVIAAFGPPRSTRQGVPQPRSIWRGDVWYYPLNPESQTAIAIRFHGNVATGVDVISVPKMV